MVDSILFRILILGCLSNKYGEVWKRHSKQICLVECTLSCLQSKDLRPLNWHMKRSKVHANFYEHNLLRTVAYLYCLECYWVTNYLSFFLSASTCEGSNKVAEIACYLAVCTCSSIFMLV